MIQLAFLYYKRKRFVYYICFLDGCLINDGLLLASKLNLLKDIYFLNGCSWCTFLFKLTFINASQQILLVTLGDYKVLSPKMSFKYIFLLVLLPVL